MPALLERFRWIYGTLTSKLSQKIAQAANALKPWLGKSSEVLSHAVKRFQSPPTEARKHAIHSLKKGMNAFNSGDLETAEHYFRRSLSYDEHYARAYAYLGLTLYKRGRLTEAVTMWNKAIEVEPGSDAAKMAHEKLAHLGHGAGGLVAEIKEQMKHRV